MFWVENMFQIVLFYFEFINYWNLCKYIIESITNNSYFMWLKGDNVTTCMHIHITGFETITVIIAQLYIIIFICFLLRHMFLICKGKCVHIFFTTTIPFFTYLFVITINWVIGIWYYLSSYCNYISITI